MTPQEAIENINNILYSDYLCDESIDYQLTTDDIKCLEMSKEALEKQIPKKTTKRQYVPNGTLIYGHCPNCDWFTENFFKYCRNCGQALDWSDTE